MIDIETLSLKKDAVILQIGAVSFTIPDFEIKNRFERNISIQSCLDIGLQIDGHTIEYWLKQLDTIRLGILNDTISIKQVLNQLNDWIKECTNEEKFDIWCLGASFDFAILHSAFEKCRTRPIWKNIFCLSTRESISSYIENSKLVPTYVPCVEQEKTILDGLDELNLN